MASLEELREERIKKIEILKSKDINPYPISSDKEFSVEDAIGDFIKLSKRKKLVTLAGRVVSLRKQGKLAFLNFDDGTGVFQAMLKKDELKNDKFELFVDTVDIGDFLEFKGELFVTKREEKTILVKDWNMLAKALRPLPDKWSGLQDTEERFRKRYLDTIMSTDAKARFMLRSKIVAQLRGILNESGFVEVETPILQPLAGGATATPFDTHHNALDIDLSLRIAPELYLKELLIGGFPKVYEIGRLFRNEGIDTTHNPEFTTIELYEAYSDASSQMIFLEKLIKQIVKNSVGKTKVEYGENEIDFSKAFKIVPYLELFKKDALINDPMGMDIKELVLKAQQLGVDVSVKDPRYKILDNIYKKVSRPKIIQPTYLVDYPAEFSPLAKRKEEDENLIDRYQLVVGGLEIVNAFSELNNPLEQRERFLEQEKYKSAGDNEAQPKDEEFIEALEHGMPPAAGLGMSIDRLVMILSDAHNIREVILFPTLRPKS